MTPLKVGDRAVRRHIVGPDAMRLFSALVGDNNPIHHDREAAQNAGFRSPIAYGMVVGSLFSEILGNQLPGAGSVYAEQSFKFLAPIHVGEEVVLSVEVISVEKDGRVVTVRTLCLDSNEQICVDGEAVLIRRSIGGRE